MVSWGTLELNDQNSHSLTSGIKINEEDVISLPSATSPQTILIGGGRRRRTFSSSGYIPEADYSSLETDFFAMTKKSLVTNLVTMNAYIKDLSFSREMPSGPSNNGYVNYTATWVEA